jgi:hypothetical protein
VFLDSDTRVLRDISAMFEPLDAFDCALAHEPLRGWDYRTAAARAFCELNTGVMAFRKSDAVVAFFDPWIATYDRMLDEQKLIADQPSFREALWSSPQVRLCTLPSEFHLVTGKPAFIAWDAHILHGRNNLEVIEGIINQVLGSRVLMPVYGLLTPYSGGRSLLRTWAHLTKHFMRQLVAPKYAATASAPGDWELRANAVKKSD